MSVIVLRKREVMRTQVMLKESSFYIVITDGMMNVDREASFAVVNKVVTLATREQTSAMSRPPRAVMFASHSAERAYATTAPRRRERR